MLFHLSELPGQLTHTPLHRIDLFKHFWLKFSNVGQVLLEAGADFTFELKILLGLHDLHVSLVFDEFLTELLCVLLQFLHVLRIGLNYCGQWWFQVIEPNKIVRVLAALVVNVAINIIAWVCNWRVRGLLWCWTQRRLTFYNLWLWLCLLELRLFENAAGYNERLLLLSVYNATKSWILGLHILLRHCLRSFHCSWWDLGLLFTGFWVLLGCFFNKL